VTSAEVAAWTAAIATLLAVIVALFKEDLAALWRRPRLTARIRLSPPDCHRTDVTVTNPQTGAVINTRPCYYLRIWIENVGKVRGEQVQVFVRRLLRKHADALFKEEPQFLPMNLKWSHTGDVFAKGISPKMGQFCDVGHIVHPSKTAVAGHSLPGVQLGKVTMCLDLEVAPNTKTHLLPPGIYRLELLVGAANCNPSSKTADLTITGEWFDDQTKMFSEGLGLREV
jgi:hypothetical protein